MVQWTQNHFSFIFMRQQSLNWSSLGCYRCFAVFFPCCWKLHRFVVIVNLKSLTLLLCAGVVFFACIFRFVRTFFCSVESMVHLFLVFVSTWAFPSCSIFVISLRMKRVLWVERTCLFSVLFYSTLTFSKLNFRHTFPTLTHISFIAEEHVKKSKKNGKKLRIPHEKFTYFPHQIYCRHFHIIFYFSSFRVVHFVRLASSFLSVDSLRCLHQKRASRFSSNAVSIFMWQEFILLFLFSVFLFTMRHIEHRSPSSSLSHSNINAEHDETKTKIEAKCIQN